MTPAASGAVVLTALRVEARALRRGGVPVLRTGMGPRHASRAGSRAMRRLPPAAPVAVAGFCGALDSGIRAGDVVVATEVRDDAGAVPLPGWAPLAAALRRRGLPVHAGPLVTSARPVLRRRGRDRLAGTGALAVDMESAAAVRALPGHPAAVVRVVTDTVRTGPTSLPGHGLAAYRALAAAAPAITEWAEAARIERVVLATTPGGSGESGGELAVRAVAAGADLVLVVGPPDSSSTSRLVDAAGRAGTAARLVEDESDIDLRWLAGVRVLGLTAGLEAPAAVLDRVLATLRGYGAVAVDALPVADESIEFTLQKEVG